MTGTLQEKNGKYYAILNFKDENGKRVKKWFSTGYEVKGNKKKATEVLNELLVKYADSTITDISKKIMFTDYIRNWLKLKKPQIDIVTYDGYDSYCKVHILPYFDKLNLDIRDVKPKHIQEYYNEKFTNGKVRRYENAKNNAENMGLSSSTLRKHRIVLNSVFQDAIYNQITDNNPVTFAKIPYSPSKTGNFYTLQQAKDLLSVIDDTVFKTLVTMVLYYGLRRSEAIGLKYTAIDFVNNKFTINHTVVKSVTTISKDKTKSDTSKAEFPLLPEVKEMLLTLKTQKEKNRILFGKEFHDNDYVFVWDDGRLYAPDFVSKKFAKIIKQNNMPAITFHNLRHSTASILLEMGWDIKHIQLWLRHADIKTSLQIYTHICENQKDELAKSLNNAFII